jgi:hypothetical protein
VTARAPALLPWFLLASVGCAGAAAPVKLADPVRPTPAGEVGRTVGDLLGNDAERSVAAERRLLALDEEGRTALRTHLAAIPNERDPRWLHVLDEQRILPDLAPDERVAFYAWKATRPEEFFVSKAQGALVAEARVDPAPLLRALERGTPSPDVLVLALALAERRDVVPALAERYVAAEDPRERRALAEALARLVGENVRPRLGGSRADRQKDAAAVLARWQGGGAPGAKPPIPSKGAEAAKAANGASRGS